jgi:hypothetical protein
MLAKFISIGQVAFKKYILTRMRYMMKEKTKLTINMT